ncbi:tetratricopeptide repeat protein [Sphingomonas sp. Leaf21]|jgi:predicted Zn-dependent protease|uniref:tetratricopeptide repeat protein n=1 Tax=Sphingomonas sp. Leaf21 TaxID=2876550 RepID=UPI001E5A7B88|nr:tetratricopeptide repeat protein [Sphingomonas sp. Leaf21]
MRGVVSVFLVAAAGMAAPAMAQDSWPQRTGFQEIAAGRYDVAEQTLLQERRASPDSPELMLNLAAVYAKTGRAAEARSLYDAVLQEKPIAMDMPSGAILSSHTVARTGLRHLPQTIAAR